MSVESEHGTGVWGGAAKAKGNKKVKKYSISLVESAEKPRFFQRDFVKIVNRYWIETGEKY